MTKKEILKILKKSGFKKVREGKHEIWKKDSVIIPIPRHKGDIPNGTARNILLFAKGDKK